MIRAKVRERKLFLTAFILGLLAVMQLGVARPLYRKVRRLETKVKSSAHTLGRMRSTLEKQKQVEAAYESIRKRITSTKNAQREIIDMLLAIEEAAKKANVKILENVHKIDKEFDHYDQHQVLFRGQGEAADLTTLLYNLQDPQQLMKILRMKFTMKNHRLEMELDIRRIVYSQENHE